jgi:TonB family protein
MAEEASEAAAALHIEPVAQPAVVSDDWGPWRRTVAPLLALLLHVIILAAVLVGPSAEQARPLPPSIPIEIVQLPKPKAEPKPKPKVEPKTEPKPEAKPEPKPEPKQTVESPPLVHLESGGSPDLLPGQAIPPKHDEPVLELPKPPPPPPPTPAAQPKPQPAQAQAPAAKAPHPVETAKLPPSAAGTAPQATPPAVTAPPKAGAAVRAAPSTPAKPEENTAMTTAPVASKAPARVESAMRGQGGGDRYLNALRDLIVSNIIYPQAARGASGVAKYVMVISRQGWMLELRLVQSSDSVALDRAGMDAIQNSAPFEPLPPNVPGKSAVIDVILYMNPPSTPANLRN